MDCLDVDPAQILTLPPVSPVIETVTSVRLGRDYYVRVAGNDYSADPAAIGQLVDVSTTLAGPGSGEPGGTSTGRGRPLLGGTTSPDRPTPPTS